MKKWMPVNASTFCSYAELQLFFQTAQNIVELLSDVDAVALAAKYNTVERVGHYNNRLLFGFQFKS